MKIILYIIFIFFFIIIILSCSSPVANPVDITKYNGTYQANLVTIQKRALTITINDDGGFGMSYENTNNGTTTTTDAYLINATNITGVDPYYSFQNGQGAGTLRFIDTNKVVVTFRKLIPDYYTIGETLCTKQ